MFSQFFGKYLLDNQKITTEQCSSCMKYIAENRVKLGLLAEHEGLLARERATELNYLQMDSDMQIGDLAVERGYLSESDVKYLLGCQGNPYLIFVQALEENKYMTRDEIDECLIAYQNENGFSDSIMDAMKNGNVERLLPAFAEFEDERYQTLLGLSLRNVIRFISSNIRFEKGEFVTKHSAKYLVFQELVGDFKAMVGFSSDDDGILAIADGYAKETFEKADEDALDSVGEFTNCICGLYAADLSYQNIQLDMLPPEYHFDTDLTDRGEFFVLPIFIEGRESRLIIQIG